MKPLDIKFSTNNAKKKKKIPNHFFSSSLTRFVPHFIENSIDIRPRDWRIKIGILKRNGDSLS